MEELLTLPGVGRKTANLVLILVARSRDNICVDTHVHRISNRWAGCDEDARSDRAGAVPRRAARWWPTVNLYLVTWGQNVCRPVYPRVAPVCEPRSVLRLGSPDKERSAP
jgi:endonuclease III